ncbi:hypothetical protein HDU92_008364 [Lobulomyces angularis]|nr:hypothetical protein HDU92_008364 [Lobulomyces angularis]
MEKIIAEKAKNYIDKFDTFLLDCDGVIWLGNSLIPNVCQTLNLLRKMNKRIIFVSNNSTKSRKEYKKKFDALGLEAYEHEIFSSAYAAAVYIKKIIKLPKEKRIYIIGMNGISEELKSQDLSWFGGSDEVVSEDEKLNSFADIEKIKPDFTVGAVLCGMDVNISYLKLAKAFTYVHSNPECQFLATNDDATFPAGGTLYPGTGALVSALATSLGRKPKVIGKPHQTMMDVIVENYHLNKSKTLMVGDRLNTDIEFGKAGGLQTLLVLTGVTTEAAVRESSTKPDHYISSFGDFAKFLQ